MNHDRRLVLIRHANHATDVLEARLFDLGLSVASLGFYSQRAQSLKRQVELPKTGALYPFLMVVQGVDEVLATSGANPDDAEIRRMILLAESTDNTRQLVPVVEEAPTLPIAAEPARLVPKPLESPCSPAQFYTPPTSPYETTGFGD